VDQTVRSLLCHGTGGPHPIYPIRRDEDPMKKAYFATVCFGPMVMLLVGLTLSKLSLNLGDLFSVNLGGFSFLAALYEGVGLFVILVDLWRSERSVARKLIWTILLIPFRFIVKRYYPFMRLVGLANLVALPAYWFLEIRKTPALTDMPRIDHDVPKARWNGASLLKPAIVVAASLCAAPLLMPNSHIEEFQEVVFYVNSLFLFVTPVLLVCAFLCFIKKHAPWSPAIWTVVSVPVIVQLFLLGKLMVRTSGGSGPDWGFVGMGTGFALLFALPEVIPGILLLSACPPAASWSRTSLVVCVILTGVSLGSLVAGVHAVVQWETVPPTGEQAETAFAEAQIRKDAFGQGQGHRMHAFRALLQDPNTPPATLARIAELLPPTSRHWQGLAANPSIPDSVVRSKMNIPWIAVQLGRNPYISPESLRLMAQTKDEGTLIVLARNTSTPRECLEFLAHGKDSVARSFARQNLAGTLGGFAYSKKADATGEVGANANTTR
jgi:hypothetical protein